MEEFGARGGEMVMGKMDKEGNAGWRDLRGYEDIDSSIPFVLSPHLELQVYLFFPIIQQQDHEYRHLCHLIP